jgi:excisionase family DNA binding protein
LKKNQEKNGYSYREATIESLTGKELLFENLNSSSIKWLTTKEAAEYLRTSPRQIRNWVYQGRVNAYRLLGKSLRFKASELDLLFKGGQVWE